MKTRLRIPRKKQMLNRCAEKRALPGRRVRCILKPRCLFPVFGFMSCRLGMPGGVPLVPLNMADRKQKRAQQNVRKQSSRAAANAILRQARGGGRSVPTAAEAHRRGIALWNANRFDDALAAFQEAHRAAPGEAALAADCAKALALRYRRGEARALFDQLIARVDIVVHDQVSEFVCCVHP